LKQPAPLLCRKSTTYERLSCAPTRQTSVLTPQLGEKR
jgi:hypothetical protein